jgi:hypothetical protein
MLKYRAIVNNFLNMGLNRALTGNLLLQFTEI